MAIYTEEELKQMEKDTLAGYVQLIDLAVYSCFILPSTKNRTHSLSKILDASKKNIQFANSKILNLWCDVREYPPEKIRTRIINYNQEYTKNARKIYL